MGVSLCVCVCVCVILETKIEAGVLYTMLRGFCQHCTDLMYMSFMMKTVAEDYGALCVITLPTGS